MIDFLRAEWTRLRTVRWWLGGVLAMTVVGLAIAFFAGLAIGAAAFPLHEHLLSASDTYFYPLGTERGPQVDAGTLALLTSVACSLALGLLFLCVWTTFTVVLASVFVRRRDA